MNRRHVIQWVTACALLGVFVSAQPISVPGKKATDRVIMHEVMVSASPETIYRLWTTTAGVKQFVGPDARIGNSEGAAYTVIFDPESDPEGLRFGTKGCRILRLQPSRFIAFEWKGTPAMPDMNVQPYPTWVEISIAPAGTPGKTRVKLAHYGFGRSPSFDAAYDFFDLAWKGVMERLQKLFAS